MVLPDMAGERFSLTVAVVSIQIEMLPELAI